MNSKIKVIFIPGNGGDSMKAYWFPYVKKYLEELEIKVIAEEFPDSDLAREKYWIPFIKKLGADENTILIGRSSGAVAAMRFAEKTKILGSMLVGACYTDLGDEKERASGYYNRPWSWTEITNNQKWIIQFASTNDPYIPIEEARFIHEKLQTEYFENKTQGHFMIYEFPELVEAIKNKIT